MKKKTVKNRGPYRVTRADEIIMSVDKFPFPCVFTFKHLIDHWRNLAKQENYIFQAQAERLEAALTRAPELLEPIRDASILDQHRDTLELMIAPFFPTHAWNTELKALGEPFIDRLFYTSPRFEQVIGSKETFVLKEENSEKKNLTIFWRLLYSYRTILGTYYKRSMVVDQPMIYTIPHLRTGLDCYYKLNTHPTFIQIENLKPLPDLDDSTLDYLVDNFHNMDLWMKYLPPENFMFSGFSLHSFVDVTVEEATARLEHILLSNHGIITDDSFTQLQLELRILFRLPDIRLGLATLQGDGALNFHSNKKSWNSLKVREVEGMTADVIRDSVYGQVIREGQSLIIEDLSVWEGGAAVESRLLEQGVKNIALAPLYYQDQLVGVLEITSPNPGDIHPLSSHKLRQVNQFFAWAVHENRERFESRVQQVIKENFTAIHPSVEWRFRDAAIRTLEQQQPGEPVEPEPIFFEQVFPLYGAADIRESSNLRNKAIRDDLVEHMNLAKELLGQVNQSMPLVINRELEFTLDKRIRAIRKGMSPGDESAAIEFILKEVNPLFRHLQRSNPALKPLFNTFMELTQSGTALLYKKRKAYESSLKMVNETIANHLVKEQQHLQQAFPHYFEKYQTDGVEYNIYIGASLVKDREFDPIYLRNLRLHQLITACAIARKIQDLRSVMEEPLQIAQLILVHSAPINVRFHMEEKQFDVDGAYNIRYEIMKKRIDKALVKGTKERITQPGHVAIIYTMEKERTEYARYIEYLQAHGYIKNDPEYLQLEELQGVQGLKAIRLEVELDKVPDDKPSVDTDTLEVIRNLGSE
ncbi:MAG: GAF domain-containing protein [Bacteroidetes bacterium]|nr:MAG: GAF domain-containing protein [Bacteroidota bacterium]